MAFQQIEIHEGYTTDPVNARKVLNHEVLHDVLNFYQSTVLFIHTEQVLATQICIVGSGKTSIACYPILQAANIAGVSILAVQYSSMSLNQVI